MFLSNEYQFEPRILIRDKNHFWTTRIMLISCLTEEGKTSVICLTRLKYGFIHYILCLLVSIVKFYETFVQSTESGQ